MKRLLRLALLATGFIAILGVTFVVVVTVALLLNGSKHSAAATVPVCQPDASALLGYINTERSKLGAPALSIDTALATSAKNKLTDEVTGQYYGHYLLNGDKPDGFIQAQGIHAAWSEDLDESALTPLSDWTTFKNSPAHYASLTNPAYTRVGIATQCTNFVLKTGTGPDDNSALVGKLITELTVVHLAAPEPVVQQAPQVQYVAPRVQTTKCYPATYSTPATCYTR